MTDTRDISASLHPPEKRRQNSVAIAPGGTLPLRLARSSYLLHSPAAASAPLLPSPHRVLPINQKAHTDGNVSPVGTRSQHAPAVEDSLLRLSQRPRLSRRALPRLVPVGGYIQQIKYHQLNISASTERDRQVDGFQTARTCCIPSTCLCGTTPHPPLTTIR